MSDTRGPKPGKVPPHIQERLDEKRRKAEERARKGPVHRRPWFTATLAAIGLLIGVAIGWGVRPDPVQAAADAVADEVAPLGNQADAIWEIGVAGAPSVREVLAQVQTGNDTKAVEDNLEDWLARYQEVIDRITAVEVPDAGESLKALFADAATLSRDAVVALGQVVDADEQLRQDLLVQAARLRVRSLEALRDARTSLAAMGGPPAPETPVPPVPEPAADATS